VAETGRQDFRLFLGALEALVEPAPLIDTGRRRAR
jgi:hypothetical protein